MPTYLYECEDHGQRRVTKTMADLDSVETCDECTGTMERVICAPQIVSLDQPWNFTHPSPNVSNGARTDHEQEAAYSKLIKGRRKKAAAKQRAMRKMGKVSGAGDCRMVSSIPRELYEARINQTGDKGYWRHEGDRALKRDGLHFGGD